MDAAIFDWDGTLVDSLPAIFRANVDVLTEYEVPFDAELYRRHYIPDWRLMYQRLGVPAEHLEAAGARWRELYASVDMPAVFLGVHEALARLSAAGMVLGLVTAGDRDVVEVQLERLELSTLISVRVCGSDDIASKPHPDPLLLALRDLGLEGRPQDAAYVGDAPDDMRMARAVGTRAVGIVSTLGTESDLFAAGAHEVAPSVADWVGRLLGPAAPG